MKWWPSFARGLVLGGAGWVVWNMATTAESGVVHDLAQRIDAASLRRPNPEVFSARDVTIGGISRPSIAASGPSRIAWDITVPKGAWVEAYVGLPAPGLPPGGDVLFRIGTSTGKLFEDLIQQVAKPASAPGANEWTFVAADLSHLSGRTISLIFNTGGPGIWGAPRVVVR